jgi:HK97 family phage prohead protease
MATISDKPWSDFSQADYSIEQWRAACLMGPGTASDNKGDYSMPVREPDGVLNRNAVHAAAGRVHQFSGDKSAAAKKIVGLYGQLKETPPADLSTLAGDSSTARSRDFLTRDFPLESIEILRSAQGGDGRTVEAYAAIFDTPTDIMDQYGHYRESIHRSAFTRTVNSGAAKKAICIYNHGYNPITGKSDIVGTVPLGTPLDIRVESRGLLTVTRYNKSPLADSVLEAIKNDDIKSQSFQGPAFRSDPQRVPRIREGQPLPLVTRLELGLRDYGPTPTPAYNEPMVTLVRSTLETIQGMDEEERQELIRALSTTFDGNSETATTTPESGSGAEGSRNAHPGRLKVRANSNWMAVQMAMTELGVK